MKYIYRSIGLVMLLTLITGGFYPLVIYAIGKTIYPYAANGSIITKNGEAIGSELIGQQFSQAGYFWSRPSATGSNPYNALASGGSNLGPLNPQLFNSVKERAALVASVNGGELKIIPGVAPNQTIPVDLVTASGSGLDPEISIAAAYFQIGRIAKARAVKPQQIKNLVDENARYPLLGFLGEPRVNVLKLNLALDQTNVNGKR